MLLHRFEDVLRDFEPREARGVVGEHLQGRATSADHLSAAPSTRDELLTTTRRVRGLSPWSMPSSTSERWSAGTPSDVRRAWCGSPPPASPPRRRDGVGPGTSSQAVRRRTASPTGRLDRIDAIRGDVPGSSSLGVRRFVSFYCGPEPRGARGAGRGLCEGAGRL